MRHLRALPRNPELLIFATIQPIMFVVLFVYVFGGSVDTPIDYTQYVIPGIFAQTVLFNSAFTGVGRRRRPEQGHHRPAALAADVPGAPCSSAARCPTSSATSSRSS